METVSNLKKKKTNHNRNSQNKMPMIGRGKPFPMVMFTDEDAIYVDQLPDLIDEQCLYKVQMNHSTWCKQTADKRYFLMQTSSRSNYSGIQEGGVCQGSWICLNVKCTFKQTSYENQSNQINF